MNKYFKILSLVIVFSFIWGAWWGFYKFEIESPENQRGPVVRWLGLRGVLPQGFVEEFSKKYELQLQVTEKNSEPELLREALTHSDRYDIIQINSFISKSFLIDNVFVPFDHDKIKALKDVSIDFKNLDYDLENKFLIPLSWGINGFLVNTKAKVLAHENLADLMQSPAQLALIASPIELFNLAIKLKPIIKTWVETGQSEELKKIMKELKPAMGHWFDDAIKLFKEGRLNVVQTSNGQAAALIGASDLNNTFVLPEERGTLWINLLGVSNGARDLKFTHHVIQLLLSPEINLRLIDKNHQASVLESSNTALIHRMQKANFIRNVPLSRVELFINREALEPTWLQAIKNEWDFH